MLATKLTVDRAFIGFALLYFAQGLPMGFFTTAVPVMLVREGSPIELVGLTSFLAIPWGAKMAWAWLADHPRLVRAGRKRAWILPAQLLAVPGLLAVGYVADARDDKTALLVGFFFVSFVFATQDIGTDALAADHYKDERRAEINAIQVGASRLGLIAGGGGVLALLGSIGLFRCFVLMAACVFVAAAALPLVPEHRPAREEEDASSKARGEPRPTSPFGFVTHLRQRPDRLAFLLFPLAFKLGDALSIGMMKPLFVVRGFSDGDIAFVRSTVGGIAALIGAALGGYVLRALGRARGAVGLTFGQAVPVALYALLAGLPTSYAAFLVASILEHVLGAAATVGYYAVAMDASRRDFRASDFAVLASLFSIVTGLGIAASGFGVKHLGYAGHLTLAAIASFLGAAACARLVPILERQSAKAPS